MDCYCLDSYVIKKKNLSALLFFSHVKRQVFNGVVFIIPRVTVTAMCNMDFSRFPLDTQTCSLEIESCKYRGGIGEPRAAPHGHPNLFK